MVYKPQNNHLRTQKTTGLDEEVARYIGENIPQEARQGLGLQRAWEKIAPPQIQEHTDNVVFAKNGAKAGKDTTILIFVDDSSWAAELNMQKEYYRIRLEQELDQAVTEVKFFASRKTALRKK